MLCYVFSGRHFMTASLYNENTEQVVKPLSNQDVPWEFFDKEALYKIAVSAWTCCRNLEVENEEITQKLVLSNNQHLSKLRQEMIVIETNIRFFVISRIEIDIFNPLFFSESKAFEEQVKRREKEISQKMIEIEKSSQHIEKLVHENERLSDEVKRFKANQVEIQSECQLHMRKFQQQETNEKKFHEKFLQAQSETATETEKWQVKYATLEHQIHNIEEQRKQQIETLEKKIKITTEEKNVLCQSIDSIVVERNDFRSKLDALREKYESLKSICQGLNSQAQCYQQQFDAWVSIRLFLFIFFTVRVINILINMEKIRQANEKIALEKKLTEFHTQICEKENLIKQLNSKLAKKDKEQAENITKWDKLKSEVMVIHANVCQVTTELKNEKIKQSFDIQQLIAKTSQAIKEEVWKTAVEQTKASFKCEKEDLERNHQEKIEEHQNVIKKLNEEIQQLKCLQNATCDNVPSDVLAHYFQKEKRKREASVELLPNKKKRMVAKMQRQKTASSLETKKINITEEKWFPNNGDIVNTIGRLTTLNTEILSSDIDKPSNTLKNPPISLDRKRQPTNLDCVALDILSTDEEDSVKGNKRTNTSISSKTQIIIPDTPFIQSNSKHSKDTSMRPTLRRRGLTTSDIKNDVTNKFIKHEKNDKEKNTTAYNENYHKNSINQSTSSEAVICWCGKPTRESKGRVYYKKVWINGIKYRQYDKCQIKYPGDQIWLAKIVGMFEEKKSGKKFMKNLWYWDRRDLLNNGLKETQLPKESFPNERFECMQSNTDINPLSLIEAKVTILHKSQLPPNFTINGKHPVYFTRYFFDLATHEIVPQTVNLLRLYYFLFSSIYYSHCFQLS
ncbi:hypothetical protein RFI_22477 [Reticulomyxa filosa]|uniref:BAH domain-containing protein n=1 Tax=Reticulomyxa filosa TaxID=46433 RepID=X6MM46_RETFI|nr:hypothetical protein RFI_22477 [Reticulomyxa filosa]|eukprot:ETO14894.1 hypothetical protein RFI_22477 [Reticulomyxa filosa]